MFSFIRLAKAHKKLGNKLLKYLRVVFNNI